MTKPGSGLDNPAYNFHPGAKNIFEVVHYSKMPPKVGEVFRLLFMYDTGGMYDLHDAIVDLTSMASHHCFKAFTFAAMQGLYRCGQGDRSSILHDVEKAAYFIRAEHKRLDGIGRHSGDLDNALILIEDVLAGISPDPFDDLDI